MLTLHSMSSLVEGPQDDNLSCSLYLTVPVKFGDVRKRRYTAHRPMSLPSIPPPAVHRKNRQPDGCPSSLAYRLQLAPNCFDQPEQGFSCPVIRYPQQEPWFPSSLLFSLSFSAGFSGCFSLSPSSSSMMLLSQEQEHVLGVNNEAQKPFFSSFFSIN